MALTAVTLKEKRRQAEAISSKRKSVDWLSSINVAAQVGLLLLAIFGYFYTVRPFYSKALLEEQIAERELELKKIRSDIDGASLLLARKKVEVDQLQTMYAGASARLMAAQKNIANLGKNLLAKQSELALLGAKHSDLYSKSSQSATQLLHEELYICVFGITNVYTTTAVDAVDWIKKCIVDKDKKSDAFVALSDDDRAILHLKTRLFSETIQRKFTEKSASFDLEIKQLKEQESALEKENNERTRNVDRNARGALLNEYFEKKDAVAKNRQRLLNSFMDELKAEFDAGLALVRFSG